MKKILIILCSMTCCIALQAQSRSFEEFQKQQNARFNQFKQDKQAEFDAFRNKQNERYAEFIKKNWGKFHGQQAVEPKEEKPVPPVIYDTAPSSQPIPEAEPATPILVEEDIVPIHQPLPQPEPIAPVEPKKDESYKTYAISFYGTLVSVGFPRQKEFCLHGIDEEYLANAWTELSSPEYDITLNNVLAARDHLSLCDWGYLKLLQAITEKRYGKTNEAVFMQAFLLSQSGYKMRLATDREKLYLLVASQHGIFSMMYFMVDNDKFYALNCNNHELYICNASFDKEQAISMQLRQEQNLDLELTQPRTLTSEQGVKATVMVNKNMIDFFNDYPSAYINDDPNTCWAVHANTPLEQTIKDKLYPDLKKAIAGLNEYDAVNKLLNFVQTAFEYEYDDKVWGSDRVFFSSETLYYPYADCEDRSILFSRIIRDLLGLDVVLLHYPGHLATAVAFTTEVRGDYLIFNNKRYVVCDPTYIHAPVGKTMPSMNNKEAKIVVL